VVLGVWATPALAADRFWINPFGGNWGEGFNWQGGVIPITLAPYDNAIFNLDFAYPVIFDSFTGDRIVEQLRVTAGNVSLNSIGGIYTLSTPSPGQPAIIVGDGIGNDTLNVSGGSGTLYINSLGTLTVNPGGTLNMSPTGFNTFMNMAGGSILAGGVVNLGFGVNGATLSNSGVFDIAGEINFSELGSYNNYGTTRIINGGRWRAEFGSILASRYEISGVGSLLESTTFGFDISGTGGAPAGFVGVYLDNGGALLSGGGISLALSNSVGTLSATGLNTTVTAQPGSWSIWGDSNLSANFFLDDQAVATFGDIEMALDSRLGATVNVTIKNGARLTARNVNYNTLFSSSNNTFLIEGIGSAANFDNLRIGSNDPLSLGTARLEVRDGSLLIAPGGSTVIGTFGKLVIQDGTANLGTLTAPAGSIEFNTGALSYVGDLFVGSNGLFGTDLYFSSNRSLTLTGLTVVQELRTLGIYGGHFSTGALTNEGTVDFLAGTLEITGPGGLIIGAVGPLGNTYTLSPGCTIVVANDTMILAGSLLSIKDEGHLSSNIVNNNEGGELYLEGPTALVTGTSLFNSGLIRGEGKLTNSVTNISTGEIRAENAKRIKLEGTNAPNAGQINLQGGTAEFLQPLTNSSTGQITGRGTLITGGTGLNNVGNIALSSGITDIFGDVLNDTGNAALGISISGNADVTFWDDVTNTSGLFRVSAGSSVTFFGTYSGGGISGTGTVYIEGDITPGFSPGLIEFEGDVEFGPSSQLVMELGGPALGTEFDHLHVGGFMSLGGTLEVELWGGFEPSLGQSFDLFDAGSVSGQFSAIELPKLGGGLAWDTSHLYSSGTIHVTAIPEPSMAGLLGVGFAGILLAILRKNVGAVRQSLNTLCRLPFGGSCSALRS
jgi:hypothetical protein